MRSRAGRIGAAAVAAAAVALAGCSDREPAARPQPRREPAAERPVERTRTRPQGPTVDVEAPGRAGRMLSAAIRDLKRVGLWAGLTRHLHAIELDSRRGRASMPVDGHLADAYYTGVVDELGAGPLCDIMFFSTAIDDDLERWLAYWDQGRIEESPPTLRRFWGSLLAHELTHCAPGPRARRSEPAAQEAERRARGRLLRAGI